MPDFHLIFCDPANKQDEVLIPFTLTGSDTSWQWLDCLHKAIYVDGLVASNNRWAGWKTGQDSAQDICDRINRHLEIAQKYHPDEFNSYASPTIPQSKLHQKMLKLIDGGRENRTT